MARTRQRAAWLAGALLLGGLAACLDPLPRELSCGDGWWDREVEACDPSSPDAGWIEGCRALGIDQDARCDRRTCELVYCGDGIPTGDEACDSNDVRGATCPSGSGNVLCHDGCTLDYSDCVALSNDGIVSESEECEQDVVCGEDEDCAPGQACYALLGLCVPKTPFEPGGGLSCSNFATEATGKTKPYASGTIGLCTSECIFGRENCGFCGDGELDGIYTDVTWPNGDRVPLPAEVCDGDQADPDALHEHCLRLGCAGSPLAGDVELACEFDCLADCQGFDTVNIGGPDALGCCLAAGSPCPVNNTNNYDPPAGVPALPCCSWTGSTGECVPTITGGAVFVCP